MRVLLIALLLAGCAGASDKLNAVFDAVDSKHMETVIPRVEAYCATTGPERRAANRARLDRGKGPILEAHCDRL